MPHESCVYASVCVLSEAPLTLADIRNYPKGLVLAFTKHRSVYVHFCWKTNLSIWKSLGVLKLQILPKKVAQADSLDHVLKYYH